VGTRVLVRRLGNPDREDCSKGCSDRSAWGRKPGESGLGWVKLHEVSPFRINKIQGVPVAVRSSLILIAAKLDWLILDLFVFREVEPNEPVDHGFRITLRLA
jgi:hypothetical protein